MQAHQSQEWANLEPGIREQSARIIDKSGVQMINPNRIQNKRCPQGPLGVDSCMHLSTCTHKTCINKYHSGKTHVIVKEQCLTWLALLARPECPKFPRKSKWRDARELAECLQPNRWAMPADELRIQAVELEQSCATFSSCKRTDGIYWAWSSSITDMLTPFQQQHTAHCLIESKSCCAAAARQGSGVGVVASG
jgi:hypothetical protein